jgi:hypothetical protein
LTYGRKKARSQKPRHQIRSFAGTGNRAIQLALIANNFAVSVALGRGP